MKFLTHLVGLLSFIILFGSPQVGAQTHPEVVIVDGYFSQNINWHHVASQLQKHHISSVAIKSLDNSKFSDYHSLCESFFVVSTEVGLAITSARDKEKSLILKRLAFEKSSNKQEMSRIVQEARKIMGVVEGAQLSVSSTGLIKISDKVWIKQLISDSADLTDLRSEHPHWVILSSDERTHDPKWRHMMTKIIGVTTIRVYPESVTRETTSSEIARLISDSVKHIVLASK